MDFHLPWLNLRNIQVTPEFGRRIPVPWSDLSMFNTPSLEPAHTQHRAIFQSHVSLSLCEWDPHTWTAYRFLEPCPIKCPGQELETEDDDEDTEDEDNDEDTEYPSEDILVPEGGEYNLQPNAIAEGRKCFFCTMAFWTVHATSEYDHLVRTLEGVFDTWDKEIRSTRQSPDCPDPREELARQKELLQSTLQVMELVKRISSHLSPALRAWASFSESLVFFQDVLAEADSIVALEDMRVSFRKLIELKHILDAMDDKCERRSKDLNLYLTLSSNDLNQQTNIFSEASNHAARTSVNLTRCSFLVFLITTPFVIALQYFGADKQIFPSFDRNPRNFIFSLCVLSASLLALTYSVNKLTQVNGLIEKTKNHLNNIKAYALNWIIRWLCGLLESTRNREIDIEGQNHLGHTTAAAS
ncbi:hypothetical protein NX059_007211 [Plenodomus lindquistii]|nr:hypothetical protein NX059_007211 [Plenodomus lindquistii]